MERTGPSFDDCRT